MKKSLVITLLLFFLLIPVTLWLGSKIPGRGYYITGTLIIIEMLIPFFFAFEGRKPQARELVLIAVMCAIAIASRVAVPIPHFKPVFAVIIISGIVFGPEAGFMVGALTAFGSNFFAGQGAYTPWQMMAYGAGGMTAGFFASKEKMVHSPWRLGLFGFLLNILWVGPLLDVCTVFTMLSKMSLKGVISVFAAGFGVNVIQSLCTFITLLLLSKPFLEKLERIKTKYGI